MEEERTSDSRTTLPAPGCNQKYRTLAGALTRCDWSLCFDSIQRLLASSQSHAIDRQIIDFVIADARKCLHTDNNLYARRAKAATEL
jgi:hypothetical protein